MTTVAAVVAWTKEPSGTGIMESLKRCASIREAAVLLPAEMSAPAGPQPVIRAGSLYSTSAVVDVLRWFECTGANFLLWCLSPAPELPPAGLKRLVECAGAPGVSLVYSDYFDRKADGTERPHQLIDFQPGSLRDDFDFGRMVLLSGDGLAGLPTSMEKEAPDLRFGGWYDLRLRLTERGQAVHLLKPAYSLAEPKERPSGQKIFDYVDPLNRAYQLEMEQVATAHLKRIGAWLDTPNEPLVEEDSPFAVAASVVIPVKNRARTVDDAVGSALSQTAPFEFNVIVVDNYSDDGTTEILAGLAGRDRRLVHLKPKRKDLGIGGCWNEAIYSKACGRYAVQLDSDDLYSGTDVLMRIVAEFKRSPCALVIGSYTTVDFDLQPHPPGLVDHREWTDSNGHNNALRIAGLGAPRAFHVPTLRAIGFENVSYGEDYAVALRLCRSYRIGRIYDSIYWCRRWEENTDSALSLQTSNRYAAYKDRLRTIEITARKERNTHMK